MVYLNMKYIIATRSYEFFNTGVGAATDSRQVLDSRVGPTFFLSRSRPVWRTGEYATPG